MGKNPLLVAFWDVVSIFMGVYLGFSLRFTIFLPDVYWGDFVKVSAGFSALMLLVFLFGGGYRVLWTQSTIEDYTAYVKQYIFGTLIFILIRTFFPIAFIPRSSFVILTLAGLVFCGTLRVSWRVFAPERLHKTGKRTIIVGAGEAGTLLARDLGRDQSEFMPVGFIDDSPEKIRRSIAGLPVYGSIDELPKVVRDQNISVVLIAMPSASSERIRGIFEMTAPLRVSVRSLPSLRELAGGHVAAVHIREIELEDLLGRGAVEIDSEGISSSICGRRVLVTGAGGSIGSETVTQLLDMKPEKLLLLGHGEQSIYDLLENIKKYHKDNSVVKLVPIIADVADTIVMPEVFRQWRPHVIYHAAAHKHVPLMQENPLESLRVNAFGTYQLASLAGEFKAERMVMISTDKAVNPAGIMGATKRIAELVLKEAQQNYPETAYMAVRFGNVLGSRGSVVPKFKAQIAAGGPVTLTHPEMRRYFMLTSEAVSLVLQAGAIGKGGEIFVLDMGEPVKIADMAEMLIRLHGFIPGEEIKIEYVGIRDGEKLFEELFYDKNHVDATSHPKIFSSRLNASSGVSEQVKLAMQRGLNDIIPSIIKMVPEFTGTGRETQI